MCDLMVLQTPFFFAVIQKLQKLWQAQEKKHNEYLSSLKSNDTDSRPEKMAKKETSSNPSSSNKKAAGDASAAATPKTQTAVAVVDIPPPPSSGMAQNPDGTVGTLYHFNEHYRTHLIRIVANYSGHKIRVITDPLEFKSEKFLKAFPLGKLPAFLLPDGKLFFDGRDLLTMEGSRRLLLDW